MATLQLTQVYLEPRQKAALQKIIAGEAPAKKAIDKK